MLIPGSIRHLPNLKQDDIHLQYGILPHLLFIGSEVGCGGRDAVIRLLKMHQVYTDGGYPPRLPPSCSQFRGHFTRKVWVFEDEPTLIRFYLVQDDVHRQYTMVELPDEELLPPKLINASRWSALSRYITKLEDIL